MNSSFVYSLLAHLLIGLLLFVSIPSWKADVPVSESAVLWVDLSRVEVANKTNLPTKKKEQKVSAQSVVKKEKIQIKQKPKVKPAPPVQKQIKQENAAPTVEEKNKKEETKQPEKIKEKPKTPVKPEQTFKEKKVETQDDDMDNLLSSVEKISNSDTIKKMKDQKEVSDMVDGVLDGFADKKTFDEKSEISVSEIDYIRNAIRKYWNVNPGIEGLDKMFVVLEVKLLPNGSIASVQIKEDLKRMKTDNAYRSVAESAMAAVRACDLQMKDESPFLQLARKYPSSFHDWQTLNLRFSPIE